MRVALTIDKTYIYEPAAGYEPTDEELATGAAAKLAPGIFGKRKVKACPGGEINGRLAQLITELRPDYFDQLPEDDRGNPARCAAFLGKHFEKNVFPWNAPPGAVIKVEVEGDPALEAALRAYLGVIEEG